MSDILLWTPLHGQAKIGRPARSYIQQLCAHTGYSLADLTTASTFDHVIYMPQTSMHQNIAKLLTHFNILHRHIGL